MSLNLRYFNTGRRGERPVAVMPHLARQDSQCAVERVAVAMHDQWRDTTPLLLADGGDGDLIAVFAISEDIDPRVTTALHLLWAQHGWFVRVFALHVNSFARAPVDDFDLDRGSAWEDMPDGLRGHFQRTMDETMAIVDEDDKDRWTVPVPFGTTRGLYIGEDCEVCPSA